MKAIVFVLSAVLFSQLGLSQQSLRDFAELSLADTLQLEIVTGSKARQTVLETPIAITVIDRDQIKRSGAVSLPELFRGILGMDVQMVDLGDENVGIRGTTSPPENSVLVLMDGKNIYQNFFGLILWEAIPISIEEIERIEIIRGPASSLYGANAFEGVINLITRKVEDNATVTLSAGEKGSAYHTVLFGRDQGKFGYRLSLNYRALDSFEEARGDAALDQKGNVTLQWDLGDERRLKFFGGYASTDGQTQAGAFAYARYEGMEFGHTGVQFETPTLSLQAFWNHTDVAGTFTIPYSPGPNLFDIKEDVYTIEYQQNWEKAFGGSRNRLIWGLGFQHNNLQSTMIDEDRSQDLYSAFFQDDYHVGKNWIFMAGLRYDDHPVTGDHYSPRGSVTYLLRGNHSFRLSYGEAFRNPTIVENYMDYTAWLDITGDGLPDLPAGAIGNPTLMSEKIRNLELGYRGSLSDKFSLGFTVFRSEITDSIEYVPLDPSNPYNFYNTFANSAEGKTFSGIEAEAEQIFTHFLKARLNYRYVDDPVSYNTFHHVLNAGVDVAMKTGFNASLRVNWYNDRFDPEIAPGEKEDMTLLNGKLYYERGFGKSRWTFFIAGFNLADKSYVEITYGVSNVFLGRVVQGGLTVEF